MSKNIVDAYMESFSMFGIKLSDGYLANKSGRLLKINATKLIMPVKENLNVRIAKKKNAMIFHPANENILLDPSLVSNLVCSTLATNANRVLPGLITAYVSMITDDASLSKLTGAKGLIYKDAPTISKTEATRLIKFIQGLPRNSIVNIALDKEREVNGDSYARVAKVTFPLYEKLVESTQTLFKGNKKIGKQPLSFRYMSDLVLCLEAIFPEIDVEDKYTGVGDGSGSPSWVATTTAAYKIFSVSNRFKDTLKYSVINLEYFDNDFASKTELIGKLAGKIPPQLGSVGGSRETSEDKRAKYVDIPDKPKRKKDKKAGKVRGKISDLPWDEKLPDVKPSNLDAPDDDDEDDRKRQKPKKKKRKKKKSKKNKRNRSRRNDRDHRDDRRDRNERKYRDADGFVITREEFDRINPPNRSRDRDRDRKRGRRDRRETRREREDREYEEDLRRRDDHRDDRRGRRRGRRDHRDDRHRGRRRERRDHRDDYRRRELTPYEREIEESKRTLEEQRRRRDDRRYDNRRDDRRYRDYDDYDRGPLD